MHKKNLFFKVRLFHSVVLRLGISFYAIVLKVFAKKLISNLSLYAREINYTKAINSIHNQASAIVETMETVESEPWENFPASPDLEITIGDSIIKCHKIMLQFRSPVFRSMFDVNMVENNTNKLTIDDIDEKTFLIFLRHLYAAPEKRTTNVEDLSIELLHTASKYMVNSLLEVFNDNFESFVKVDNAIEFAIMASQNGLSWSAKLVNFIADNYKLIRERENFGLLKHEVDFMVALFDKLTADPELSCSTRQQNSAEIRYTVGMDVSKSITTTGGWNLSVSHAEGHGSVFVDIDKENFDSKYIYHMNILIDIKNSFGEVIDRFKSSCIYSGQTIRQHFMSKASYQSCRKFDFKLEYWKNQK